MKPERLKRIQEVVAKRQLDLTVILENVHDQHNIGAVLRSCDAVGIGEVYVIYNHPAYMEKNLTLGKRTSAGTRRWMDVHFYQDTNLCFRDVRRKYRFVWATHMSESARDLYDLDLKESTALVFGNEHDGLSQESLAHCDGNFLIPMAGMVQSLNISVACAVSLFEAMRQRKQAGQYDKQKIELGSAQEALLQEYIKRHEIKADNSTILPKGK